LIIDYVGAFSVKLERSCADDAILPEPRLLDPDYSLFARIVEAGSLAAAARALGISPAMVSKRLSKLEARLGAELIWRSTRHMELTTIGARFHADVLDILAAVELAELRLSGSHEEPAGPLRIVAPTSFWRLHVSSVFARFLEQFPKIAAEIDLSDEYTDLLRSRTDVAIRITAKLSQGLVGERLADSRRALCAAPAYLARHGAPATIADLQRHRLLAAKSQMPWRLSRGGRITVFPGKSFVVTNSSEAVRELTLNGVGIALRSLWDVGEDLAAGRLTRVLADFEGSTDVGIFAVRTPSTYVPASVAAFIAALAEAFRPIPPWERG